MPCTGVLVNRVLNSTLLYNREVNFVGIRVAQGSRGSEKRTRTTPCRSVPAKCG